MDRVLATDDEEPEPTADEDLVDLVEADGTGSEPVEADAQSDPDPGHSV